MRRIGASKRGGVRPSNAQLGYGFSPVLDCGSPKRYREKDGFIVPMRSQILGLSSPSTVTRLPGSIFVFAIEFLVEQNGDWTQSRANDFHCRIFEWVGTHCVPSFGSPRKKGSG